MRKYWTVFVEGTDGGRHYRHTSLASANTEAERLAQLPLNRGRKVFVMEMVAYCYVPETPVNWCIL